MGRSKISKKKFTGLKEKIIDGELVFTSPDGAYKIIHGEEVAFLRKMILRTQKNKEGKVAVYIEVRKKYLAPDYSFKYKHARINTGVYIDQKHWSKSKKLILPKEDDAKKKNAIVNQFYNQINDYINTLDIQSSGVYRNPVRFESIIKMFPPPNKPRKTLTTYFDEYIKYRQAQGTPRGTWKEFITVKNRLIAYENHLGYKLEFRHMNLTFSDDFSIWLREENEKNGEEKRYADSTIEKTFTVLITLLNHYYELRNEQNIIIDDTFRSKKFKKGKKSANPANPLSYDEFKVLFSKKFESKSMEMTKDRFLLQCSTGLRYSDMDKIKPQSIVDNRIAISPIKTTYTKSDNMIYIDLNKYSVEILEKYNFDTSILKISNQKYNKNLEKLWENLEWEKRTSHNARDTFISICIENRIPIEVILKWTGQSSYSILKRYIKTADEFKKQEMNRAFQ